MKTLNDEEKRHLFALIKQRVEKENLTGNQLDWKLIEERLNSKPDQLYALNQMEATGGEPNIISIDNTGAITFFDCVTESPSPRRSLCYDQEALDKRKKHKPDGNAITTADQIGIKLLDEDEYRLLQSKKPVDMKTSSWLTTPEKVRKLGGAIFGDRRYDQVFIYHNGADSYYGSRGIRGVLMV